jgi:hypothetical protein
MGRWNAILVEGTRTTWINDTATKKEALAVALQDATN